MNMLRNLLAVIGALAIVAGLAGFVAAQNFLARLDPGAPAMYIDFAKRYMENLDPAIAMVRKIRVDDGLSIDDVVDSMKSIAAGHHMLFVGEAPFSRQVEAVTGKPYRYVNFFSFCDVGVGAKMADYHNAYTAFMPCRIALVQDDDGTLWLQMMDLDMMIYGGKPLPPDLREGALWVSATLNDIMEGAARGEF